MNLAGMGTGVWSQRVRARMACGDPAHGEPACGRGSRHGVWGSSAREACPCYVSSRCLAPECAREWEGLRISWETWTLGFRRSLAVQTSTSGVLGALRSTQEERGMVGVSGRGPKISEDMGIPVAALDASFEIGRKGSLRASTVEENVDIERGWR